MPYMGSFTRMALWPYMEYNSSPGEQVIKLMRACGDKLCAIAELVPRPYKNNITSSHLFLKKRGKVMNKFKKTHAKELDKLSRYFRNGLPLNCFYQENTAGKAK